LGVEKAENKIEQLGDGEDRYRVINIS